MILLYCILSLQMGDMPPIVLDPSQFYNYTQPQGNHMPITNAHEETNDTREGLARADDLLRSFEMPSGFTFNQLPPTTVL